MLFLQQTQIKIPNPNTQINVAKKKKTVKVWCFRFYDQKLMQTALQRSENGEQDLQAFAFKKSPKVLSEIIATKRKIQATPEIVAQEQCNRMSITYNHAAGEYAANCQGEWIRCIKKILQNNETTVFFFTCALRNAFLKCRQKNTSILIVGPTNCWKSFLLNQLELIFKAFFNPSTSWHA